MKERALTAIDIDALAPSTLTAPDGRREPGSLDSGDYTSKPETQWRALHRLINSFALASYSMAGVYVGVWLDPPNVSGNRTDGKDETSRDRAGRRRSRVAAMPGYERQN